MKLIILDRDGLAGAFAEHCSALANDRPRMAGPGHSAMDGYGAQR